MKDSVRKLVVIQKKKPKSILVVTNSGRMRPMMAKIRALGYECTMIEAGGGARTFLLTGKRVNLVVIDLRSAESAEKLILWIKGNRPGIRVVCILTNADCVGFGPNAIALGADKVVDESDIDKIPEVLRSILE